MSGQVHDNMSVDGRVAMVDREGCRCRALCHDWRAPAVGWRLRLSGLMHSGAAWGRLLSCRARPRCGAGSALGTRLVSMCECKAAVLDKLEHGRGVQAVPAASGSFRVW